MVSHRSVYRQDMGRYAQNAKERARSEPADDGLGEGCSKPEEDNVRKGTHARAHHAAKLTLGAELATEV